MDLLTKISKNALPTVVAMVIFLAVSVLYFAPQFRGEVLPQHDVVQYEGMAHDIKAQRAATGEDPQWTGGMFGGMPAYLINVAFPAQMVKNTLGRVVQIIDTPAAFLFFSMVAFWLMLVICGVGPWAATVGALAYGLSTYFMLIISAGHITKMWALVYAPLMMGGAWMTLRGPMWRGAALTAVATSLEIGANHPQITYYFLMAMAAFWISECVVAWREGRMRDIMRRTAVLAAAGIVAVASNFSPLWYTAQHTPETIRGGSELAVEGAGKSGLDLDYATAWSYGRTETLNLLVPDFMGRDSMTPLPDDGATAAVLNDTPFRGIASQLPAYWGDQPYTGGPTYLGAAAIFLAVLGLILARGRDRWWMIAIAVLMILLSWGRNFMDFTELAFKVLPGYNKFRTVSMTLVVVQWLVPLAGALALAQLWRGEVVREKLVRAVAVAGGVTGGLCLLLAVAGSAMFDFGAEESSKMMTDYFGSTFREYGAQEYLDAGMDVEWGEAAGAAMAEDRAAMMSADAWRSLLMILLAAAAVLLFAFGWVNRYLLTGTLGLIMLIDLVPVDLRFLSGDNFTDARAQRVVATAADKAIMADKDLGYRVLNSTVSTFNDATTSYFHRSVGGYHGAKLARYQDIIDYWLSDGRGGVDTTPEAEAILDMLNTRYEIVATESGPQPLRRTTALGAAWFVDNAVTAATAEEEIAMLGNVNLATSAVVAERDAAHFDNIGFAEPDTRSINLAEYRPNYLKYTYTSPEDAVAVFSEIFYDKGWTAYIDGEEAPYFRADYILRAMSLPAGEHTVEWRFRAPNWTLAEGITGVASAIILLGVVAVLVLRLRKKEVEN